MRIMNTCNKKCDCIGGLKFVSVAPALTGAMKPEKGLYCNAIVRYEETGEIWIYTKEGIPVDITSSDPAELERKIREVAQNLSSETAARIAADLAIEGSLAGKQNEITTSNKLDADLVDDSTSDNKFATAEELSAIGTAVQPEDINYTLVSGLALDSNPSTTTMQLDASKVNISSGTTSSENIPFAVASSTQAGIMNSATFNAVTDNTNNINALLNGAVAVTGLPATPTQAQLTTAWQTETGLTTLINRAQIYDVANSKVWTYYTNDTTWHEATAGGQITINTFTNLSEGTIKGSTNVGQVFAENDGTGSVNGWDALDARVTNNTNNMIRVGSVISQPTTVAYVDTANIIDGAVTANKIDFSTLSGNYSTTEQDTGYTWIDGTAIYKKTISLGNLPNAGSKDVNHGISNLAFLVDIKATASNGTFQIPLPLAGALNIQSQVAINVQATKIEIVAGDDRSSYTGYATLYYTKTS